MIVVQRSLYLCQRYYLLARLPDCIRRSNSRCTSASQLGQHAHYQRLTTANGVLSRPASIGSGSMVTDNVSSQPAVQQNKQIWVFGFGSLVHHPNFEHSQRIEGYVRGWKRVFHQGSTDHRGTPEAPGRTVTLVQEPDSITWGAAYHLAGTPEQQAETLKYLEWREKQYDLRYKSNVYGKDGSVLVEDALVYIATPDKTANVNWLGPAPLPELAHQIAHAHGPSGPNNEYLYKLADVMRKMGVDDPELFELEAAVKQICARKAAGSNEQQ